MTERLVAARRKWECVITCEHGGNRVPAAYRRLFRGASRVLQGHRGYDAGALPLARALARSGGAPLFFSETTRLLVDLNRSIGHPRQFSEWTRVLSHEQRQPILERYYHPFRERVLTCMADLVKRGRAVLHISVHSFTSQFNGQVRTAPVGLLFDPSREPEATLARGWQQAWRRECPEWTIRRNYPYLGTADGHTTHLRRQFPSRHYAGIELEINQSQLSDPRLLERHTLSAWQQWHKQ